jgi:hypothetical protein
LVSAVLPVCAAADGTCGVLGEAGAAEPDCWAVAGLGTRSINAARARARHTIHVCEFDFMKSSVRCEKFWGTAVKQRDSRAR